MGLFVNLQIGRTIYILLLKPDFESHYKMKRKVIVVVLNQEGNDDTELMYKIYLQHFNVPNISYLQLKLT